MMIASNGGYELGCVAGAECAISCTIACNILHMLPINARE